VETCEYQISLRMIEFYDDTVSICMKDSIKKSLAKTITWRIIALVITSSLVFIVTKDLTLATSIGILDLTIKSVVYFVHERIWNKY
jgi:uncharacterized membrane protein